MDFTARINNILTGSCTPASDLLALIQEGAPRAVVDQRWRARCAYTLAEAAEIERSYQVRNDI